MTADGDVRRCKLCGGETQTRFSAKLAGRWTGEYHECVDCLLLQSFHLDDLSAQEVEEVYGLRSPVDGDPGATWRLAHVGRRVEQLAALRMLPLPSNGRVLDFGSGSNFVVGYLGHRLGTDAWGYDPYGTPAFAMERAFSKWDEVVRAAPFHLVIASEVFEHFIRPREDISSLRQILAPSSALFVTTGRYLPGEHGPDWSYLAPHSGQHVAFYSTDSMQEVASILGYTHVYTVGAPSEWLLTTPASPRKRVRLGLGAALLRAAAHVGFPSKLEST